MRTVAELIKAPPPKEKCCEKGCPSMAYYNGERFLCVICDHEQFEECRDCCNLVGWCTCNGEERPVGVEPEDNQNTKDRIVDALLAAGEPMRSKDLPAVIPRKMPTINWALRELCEEGLVVRVGWGRYGLPESRSRR